MNPNLYNIFCIWSGDNEMSENRHSSLISLKEKSGCNVILVNPTNLHEYIIEDHPINKAYEYLSYTHRSDYLRAYLMYHHGGGYSDIKQNGFDWMYFFNKLYETDNQFIGYAETAPHDIASNQDEVKSKFRQLAGMGHFIFKKNTSIAKQWLTSVENILDSKIQQIKENPGTYHPRAVCGGAFGTNLFTDSKYPLGWNEILGSVLHPICYNNIGSYEVSMPYPRMFNYR